MLLTPTQKGGKKTFAICKQHVELDIKFNNTKGEYVCYTKIELVLYIIKIVL